MYYLWTIHWGFWAWWPMFFLMATGYGLAHYWQRNKSLLRPPELVVPTHWTNRDKEAWKLVEARAARGRPSRRAKLTEPSFFLQTAQEMANELATFYHPGTANPIDYLTIPEILAVVELASHDLCVLVEHHLPGGHLLTIRDMKRAQRLTELYQKGSNIFWAISALFNPVETGLRYGASQLGMSTPLRMLQQNLFVWFYTAYVQRLGNYLIDLNSGRLRVGASRYRELVEQMQRQRLTTTRRWRSRAAGPFPAADGDPADAIAQVTITIIGQTKVGKSSLINALLGEQRARTGVVPADRLHRPLRTHDARRADEARPAGHGGLRPGGAEGGPGRGDGGLGTQVRPAVPGAARAQPRPSGRPRHAGADAAVVRGPAGRQVAADHRRDDAHRPVDAGDGVGTALRLDAAEAPQGGRASTTPSPRRGSNSATASSRWCRSARRPARCTASRRS